jgi:hypothetical protein
LTGCKTAAVEHYRERLMASGLNRDRVDTLARRYSDKQLRLRASNIARTEIMCASNQDQQALWQQAIEKRLLDPNVDRKWVTTPDDRRCTFCRAMAGQRRKMHERFVCPLNNTSVHVPPLHPSCRCVVVLDVRSFRRAA